MHYFGFLSFWAICLRLDIAYLFSDRVVDEMNPVENFSRDELTKLLTTSWVCRRYLLQS